MTLRSLLIGTFSVAALCAFAPFNDFLIVNTPMVGSYLPLVVVLALFFLVVVVNAPLNRFAPDFALSSKELCVILAMLLAGSAIPTQGLLRFWLPMLVAPFRVGQQDPEFWKAFSAVQLPSWIFPVRDVADGRSDSIVSLFYNRIQPGESVPYGPWIAPLLGWSVFIAGWLTALVALAVMVVPQWARNERLPFPLAQIEAAIIEPPQRGKWLNRLFSSRLFWFGLASVFIVHNVNALSQHFHGRVPEIPLSFDLTSAFSERPWSSFGGGVKAATIYFTFIGITYFVQTRVAFSLWSIYLLLEIYRVQLRTLGSDLPEPAAHYQHVGASITFACGVLWLGRQHWARVFRDLVGWHGGAARDKEQPSYRMPAILFLVGCAVMFAWLLVVGMQSWVAIAMIGLILLGQIVVTRFVAETGVPFFRFYGTHTQLLAIAPQGSIRPADALIAGLIAPMGALGTREALMPLATHALRVEQEIVPERPRTRVIVAVMGWALLVGFVVGSISSLNMYYRNATPITSAGVQIINPQGLDFRPRTDMAEPLKQVASNNMPKTSYSPLAHLSTGIGIAAVLQVLALRYSAWPFMPVGYVACFTWYMQIAWYSIMLGWVVKAMILRFGGASFYQAARPLFIGIIFGEALAAATWLVINMVLAMNGFDYYPVNVLPV